MAGRAAPECCRIERRAAISPDLPDAPDLGLFFAWALRLLHTRCILFLRVRSGPIR